MVWTWTFFSRVYLLNPGFGSDHRSASEHKDVSGSLQLCRHIAQHRADEDRHRDRHRICQRLRHSPAAPSLGLWVGMKLNISACPSIAKDKGGLSMWSTMFVLYHTRYLYFPCRDAALWLPQVLNQGHQCTCFSFIREHLPWFKLNLHLPTSVWFSCNWNGPDYLKLAKIGLWHAKLCGSYFELW